MNYRQMMKTEAQCIEEHMPQCQASCPIHVQVRNLIKLLKVQDYDQAAELFQKQSFFPRLVAAACPAPCEGLCKRAELDDGIAINDLEKIIVENGSLPILQIIPYMNINKKAAVIGGGISGMSAAWFLYEKGFQVTVFEKEHVLGGRLRQLPQISSREVDLDFAPLTQSGVEFKLATEVGKDISFEEIRDRFDAIYLSGSSNFEKLGIAPSSNEKTFQSSISKIFLGGSILREDEPYTMVLSISDGRRAAISMDRFMKNVSLTAARYQEGPCQTALYTSLTGVEKAGRVMPKGARYTMDEAQIEANRCLDCHCLECVKACKFLQRFEKFPRLYIREIANTVGLVGGGSRSGKNLMVACTMCGLCRELCPNGIPMADVVKSGKQEMVKKGELSPAIYDFPVRDMLFSNSDEFSLCKNMLETGESRYMFFPGCQMAATMPQYISPCYDYLREKLDSVGLFLGCCGAPADWSGQERLFSETMSELIAKWEEKGKPAMIVGCTTCSQQFKAAKPEMKVINLWQIFAEYGLPKAERNPQTVAIHDPCTARHDTDLQEAVRQILVEAGYVVTELEYSRQKTKCCGYGGLVFYGDKGMAGEMVKNRTAESHLDFVAYCSVCRDYFVRAGKPSYHILDIIWGQDTVNQALKKGADISQKEANRIKLKRDLLKKYWHEEMPVLPNDIKLMISDPVREILEERLITDDTIRQVIAAAEAANKRLIRPTDGHYIISHKPGIITYWVEYLPKDGYYEIFNAYSHRIRILGD